MFFLKKRGQQLPIENMRVASAEQLVDVPADTSLNSELSSSTEDSLRKGRPPQEGTILFEMNPDERLQGTVVYPIEEFDLKNR